MKHLNHRIAFRCDDSLNTALSIFLRLYPDKGTKSEHLRRAVSNHMTREVTRQERREDYDNTNANRH